jgi:hypothetical protein
MKYAKVVAISRVLRFCKTELANCYVSYHRIGQFAAQLANSTILQVGDTFLVLCPLIGGLVSSLVVGLTLCMQTLIKIES